MGSQLQLCTTVGSQLLIKMHKVLVASCLAAAAYAEAEPGYLGYGYGYGLGGVSTGVGLHPTGSIYESRSTQGLGKRALMLMLSQDITHRTTGHPLPLHTVTPPAMDAVVSVVPSQDILVLGMAMDMALEVSA